MGMCSTIPLKRLELSAFGWSWPLSLRSLEGCESELFAHSRAGVPFVGSLFFFSLVDHVSPEG